MKNSKGVVFYVMGVSGTGKSTVGKLLSNEFNIPFYDGDDYHPQANIDKMAAGNALNDDDRLDWLLKLNELALGNQDQGAVIACSSLKKKYRTLLNKNLKAHYFIYLEGSFDLIFERITKRKDHFMNSKLLKSQFDTLETPDDTESLIPISITHTPEEIIAIIKAKLS